MIAFALNVDEPNKTINKYRFWNSIIDVIAIHWLDNHIIGVLHSIEKQIEWIFDNSENWKNGILFLFEEKKNSENICTIIGSSETRII